jgi:hypothetical protein
MEFLARSKSDLLEMENDSDHRITCDCGLSQSLAAALNAQTGTLGFCNGRRPWLGPYSKQS